MTWHTPMRVLGLAVLGFVSAVLLYLGAAFGLALIPGRPVPPPDHAEAYVVSNGVHTDLVLPVRGGPVDWATVFPPSHFPSMPPDTAYVAVGWGDREFYLHTPEWKDLTARRAFGALSGTGRTLLHVTWLRPGELGRRTWRLPLDNAGHEALARHIRASLAPDAHGRAVPVAGAHYGRVDAFFEARGRRARGAMDPVRTERGVAPHAARRHGARYSHTGRPSGQRNVAAGVSPGASNSRLASHAPGWSSAAAFSIARGMLSGRWNR